MSASKSAPDPPVPHFSMKRVPAKVIVASIGQTESGKSYVTYDILRRIKPDLVLVFAGTIGAFELASNHVHEPAIHCEFVEAALRNAENMMITSKRCPHLGLPKTLEVVFDDLGTSGVLRTNKYLQTYFTEKRHIGIGVKLCIHSYSQLKPEARNSFKLTLIFDCANNSEIQTLQKHFSPVDSKTFRKYLRDVTGDYKALVIDNLKDKEKGKTLFWYKAKIKPTDTKIGRPDLQEFFATCCKSGLGWPSQPQQQSQTMILEAPELSD